MLRIRRAVRPALLALALLLTGGSCEPVGEGPRTIDRLAERAVPVACAPVGGVSEDGSVVMDLTAVSDSTFLALLPLERRVVLFGPDLAPVFSIGFDLTGPRGVTNPRSATLVADSLVYVADTGPRRIRVFDRSGADRGTIRLPFPPSKVRWTPAGVVAAAFPLGVSDGEALVWLLVGEESRPLGLPIEPRSDPRAEAVANLLDLTVLPGGDVVAAHQVISSRAGLFRARPGGGFDAALTTTPVASSERKRLGRVPRDLFESEDVGEIAAIVIAGSADWSTGEYLYLTRTGGELPGGGSEKAIVRAGPDLSFVAAYRLDVDAQAFVHLSKSRTAIVIDDEARWHRCALP